MSARTRTRETERTIANRIKRESYYAAAPPDSPRQGHPWTAAEDELVATTTHTVRVLAAVLQRSMKAVEGRRTILRKRNTERSAHATRSEFVHGV